MPTNLYIIYNTFRCNYGSLQDEFQKISDAKAVVSLTQIKSLLGNVCRLEGCGSVILETKYSYIGI